MAAGYHVFIAVDASRLWTKEINNWALQRLIQAGAKPTNVQSIFGELENAAMKRDPKADSMPRVMAWLAPALIGENFAVRQS